MKENTSYKILLVFCVLILFWSCSSTKYVGKDEYLLNRVKLEVKDKKMSTGELKKTIRQRPNTRILGVFRFHLGLYNLSGKKEEKRFNRWLRSIGEAPVIYSPFMTDRSKSQIELYLDNKGYYNATVRDSVTFRKKKAHVNYYIDPGEVVRVEDYSFRDKHGYVSNELADSTEIVQMMLTDTVHTLLRRGMPMDIETLENERERITKMLRENGYFNFSKNFIQYYADTTRKYSSELVHLLLSVADKQPDSTAYQKYSIGKIQVNLDYNPLLMLNEGDSAYVRTKYGDCDVIYSGKLKIKPGVILESIQFKEGELYNVKKVTASYARLQALNLFKFINIVFKPGVNEKGEAVVNCEILLTPLKRQSYNVFLEGTNNSGNIGVGGNFQYSHRNLFHGGENITWSIWGALKKERMNENKFFSTTEFGTELKLVTPQFWMPVFWMKDFRRNFAPKTSVTLSYSREKTRYYERQIASAKFGYLWNKADKKWRYGFDLVDLNYVLMKNVDTLNFVNALKNEYIKSAYTDHMILSANFSASFTDQVLGTHSSYNYFRGNIETSGNFLLAIDKLFQANRVLESNDGHYYKALGVRYAQFVKADGEYRFNHYVNPINSVVYRLFIGVGYPYGNMKALPFEEAYYCGGANGMRAWHSRTLGPGSHATKDNYPNNVGDFKLEANVEYRFKLFWLLEGALFLDVGNVWNITKYEDRPGTKLSTEFYKQLAAGTGLGLRLDANYFLLRFDVGIKMFDPSQAQGDRFLWANRNWGFREVVFKQSVFNIAIGYPF